MKHSENNFRLGLCVTVIVIAVHFAPKACKVALRSDFVEDIINCSCISLSMVTRDALKTFTMSVVQFPILIIL